MSITSGADPAWIEEQYLRWKREPEAVSPEWRAFFRGYDLAAAAAPPGLPSRELLLKQSGVQSLIYRYRDIGHLLACTDPLSPCSLEHPLLSLSRFGLEDSDLDNTFVTRRFLKEEATLREIVETLRETYCRSVGVEYMYIQEPEERQWLQERMEPSRNRDFFDLEERLRILRGLQQGALFEEFLHRRFPGQKRFSLEGGDSLIPLLDFITSGAAEQGCSDLVLGMAHRGRLNVLAHIFGKPYENIFAEFRDNVQGVVGDGDVKYHKRFSSDRTTPHGSIHLTIAPNPSHLEAVDPVVEGKARARQERCGEGGEQRVLPLLIHGDAAFAAQGMVLEVLNLSQLEGYRTGGTIHIVVNNQIGFTTRPEDARSSRYSTDPAKTVSAPIFHVHGEDPEAVVHVGLLALAYRRRFRKDVVIDLVCYRRHGHNEGDEPYFTQPLMYERIRKRSSVHRLYAQRLQEEGVPRERIEGSEAEISAALEEAFQAAPRQFADAFSGVWSGIRREYEPTAVETAVPAALLRELSEELAALPEGFTPHPKVAALLQKRREGVDSGGIDWGSAETLAYATLLREGTSIRLSGQDSRRGTFNHRHSTLYDMISGNGYVPLDRACRGGASFHAYDSSLSEQGVLGFEYGYSLESPGTLTIWEAQFGDFANGAQVIIDQFLAAGETKWERVSGLTLFLPHGYEGMGAEHSSARIERWLQLCAADNLQVVYPSAPAQMFHLLRRQVRLPFRRPLVVFTPKSLLRHPLCVSRLSELEEGGFLEVLAEGGEEARRVLFCSGKIYYELLEKKEREERRDVAIVRIEQLYPLREDLLRDALASFPRAAAFAWVQEEPRNMGAGSFLLPRLARILGKEPAFVSRPEDAAPAVGSHRVHEEQQGELLRRAFEFH